MFTILFANVNVKALYKLCELSGKGYTWHCGLTGPSHRDLSFSKCEKNLTEDFEVSSRVCREETQPVLTTL